MLKKLVFILKTLIFKKNILPFAKGNKSLITEHHLYTNKYILL